MDASDRALSLYDYPVDSDFWMTSGFHLLDRDDAGRLTVTDRFLRAYLDRPELALVPESCPCEVSLHDRLREDPTADVAPSSIDRIADIDARENLTHFLRFRDGLLSYGSLECFYISTIRRGRLCHPPLFLEQITQAILRNLLDGCNDPFRLRAAELLFRTQKANISENGTLLADEEIVELYAQRRNGGFGSIASLLVSPDSERQSVELDVLQPDNQNQYWQRSDCYDMVLDLTFGRPGLDALCRVLEAWVAHFLDVTVSIQPVQSIRDERWRWHLGLDSASTRLLNDLYNGADVSQDQLERLIALFRLEFDDPGDMQMPLAGCPIYVGLAVNQDRMLRMKPQNLLVNLPIARH